jgi:N6-L-threonylcarbamoyladenine synthase
VRSASRTDLASLIALERRCFDASAWGAKALDGELNRTGSVLRVAEQGGGLVGASIGWAIAGEAELLRISVDPAARRRGLGRLLLLDFHSAARALGAERCLLEVRANNRAAIGLYRSARYSVDGKRGGYYSDGTDALLMSLPLTDPG